MSSGPWSSPWAWVGLGVAVLAIAGIGVLLARYRTTSRTKKSWKEFTRHSERVGLSEAERGFLANLARLSGLKQPQTIFTMESAFDLAVRNGQLEILNDNMQKRARATLSVLREKLGFVTRSEKTPPITTQQITAGVKLEATMRGGDFNAFEVLVTANSPQAMTVRPLTPVECQSGDKFRLRYSNMGAVWEFETAVIGRSDDVVTLEHTDKIRFINRRRFPRVPTARQAFVSNFAFMREEDAPPPLHFTPAELVEIAGPGLKFQTGLEASRGDRVLVVIRFPGKRTLQAIGVVRRVLRRDKAAGGRSIAVELISLETNDVAELARETNITAQQNANAKSRADRPAPAVVKV